MLNAVSLVGRVVSPIQMTKNTQGKIEGRLTLEVKNPFKSELGQEQYDYITVMVWRGVAEMLQDCTSIGSMIALKGRIGTRIVKTDNNQEINTMEVIAEYVEMLDKHFQK